MAIEYIDKSKANYRSLFLEHLIRLSKLLKERKISNKNIDKIYDNILIHIFKHIINEEKQIGNEYISGLNDILQTGIQLGDISNDIIDFSTSLGKFGQNSTNRKFSVYFCVAILRLLQRNNEDIFKRLFLLGEDSERTIRYELSYHLRFLFYLLKRYDIDSKEKENKINNLIEIARSYFSDNDILMKSLLINSLIINIECFEDSFIKDISQQIDTLFNYDEKYLVGDDLSNIVKVFETIIDTLYSFDKPIEKYRCLVDTSIIFIDKYILLKRKKCFDYTYLFPIFNKVANILELYNQSEIIERIFFFVYYQNISEVHNCYNEQESFMTTGDNFNLEFSKERNKYRILFYQNIHMLLTKVSNKTLSKNVLENVFYFIFKDELYCDNDDEVNEYDLTNNEMDNEKMIVLEHISSLFEVLIDKNLCEFFDCFVFSFEKMTCFLSKIIQDGKYYNLLINFIKALRISIEYIYNNIKTYENYFSKVIQYCKNWLKEETSCEINKEIIKLLIVIIKFSLQREDLFSYLKQEFYSNQSFYSRRIYVLFIKYSFDILSYEFITKVKILELAETMKTNDILIIKESLSFLDKLPKDEKEEERKIKEEKVIFDKEKKMLEEQKKEDEFYLKRIKNGKGAYKTKKSYKSAKNVSILFTSNNTSNKKNSNTKFEKITRIRTKKRESENNITFNPKSLFTHSSPNQSPPFPNIK